MFHASPDRALVVRQWRSRPPTGPQLRHVLAEWLSDEEMEENLARETNRSVAYVRWCLNSEAVIPACLLAATLRMSDRFSLANMSRYEPYAGAERLDHAFDEPQ